MGTTAPALGRVWWRAAFAVGAVIVAGLLMTPHVAEAESVPASFAGGALPPDVLGASTPVLTCRTPKGSPLPTPSVTPAPLAVAAPAAPVVVPAPSVSPVLPTPAPTARDATAPSAPADLSVALTSQTGAKLTWSPASDDVGVTAYEVWGSVYFEVPGWATICAATLMTTVDETVTSVDVELAAPVNPKVILARYTFFVKARDAAGNVSPQSDVARITVPSA